MILIIPENSLDKENGRKHKSSEEESSLNKRRFDEAESSDGQESSKAVPVDAHQLNITSLTSTTETKPPKIRTNTAITYGHPKAMP